jgi:hypothetical protein
VSHRKEQKEALRKEREERERQAREAKQRKRVVGFGAAGLIVIAALVVVVVAVAGGGGGGGGADDAAAQVLPDGGSVPEQRVFDLAVAAKDAGCELKSSKGSGVATHTNSLSEKINYDTNPPATGRHFQTPGEDGAYGEAPPDELLVHNLEHGRVIVWFKPNMPESERADLKALFDEDPYQMVMVPRRDMPYTVAASAWNRDPVPGGTGRRLLCEKMDSKTFDAIRTFRDEHRSNGPEPVP